jgi:hypothetical protein
VSTERLGNVLPDTNQQSESAQAADVDSIDDADTEVIDFVRFCYRRRSVAWPELYDEMCAVAARGAYRGMTYEQLERLGIGFALAALPRMAAMAARVIAEERGPQTAAAPLGA